MTKTTACLLLAGLMAASTATARPKKKSKTPKPGDAAPAFQLRALDRAMVRLSDLAYEGRERSYAPKRPVLLDFFRTDCEPCLAAMPELVKTHEKYQARGLYVLLVALVEEGDDDAKKLQRYLDEKKLPFTVVVDRADYVSQKYLGKVVALPATFLIDREGKVVKSKHDAKGSLVEYFSAEIETTLAAHDKAKPKKKK
ncbi:MAG: TlpA disulfide reductase family protein [Deltaproteobacteria bacterium]